MLSLLAVQVEVDRLASIIGAAGDVLPTFGHSEDGARPHVEVDGRGFHYVVVERGEERRRITTQDLDELLYHVFEAITFSLACDFELAHRIEEQDCRRMLFAHQIELLSMLSSAWAQRESRDHDRILHDHPFDDVSHARVQLIVALRDQGRAADDALRMACERYPLPTEQVL